MKGKNSKLNVIYSSDDNYVQYLGISIISLLENNKEFKEINVFIIDNEIKEENKKIIYKIIEKYNRKVVFIDFNKYKNMIPIDEKSVFSISSYARLLIQEMLPIDIDKVIYLDSDTIINKSLEEMWNIEIDNYMIGGVRDFLIGGSKEKVGLRNNQEYINAGILLINVKKWRERDVKKEFIKFIEKHNGKVFHHDQGVINAILSKDTKILPLECNAMTPLFMRKPKVINKIYEDDENKFYSVEEIETTRKNPMIIHFTTGLTSRPWMKNCKHPMKNEYIKYSKISPWKDCKLEKDDEKIKTRLIKFIYRHLPYKIYRYIIVR